jgi:shikimate 5-dehydrogenase
VTNRSPDKGRELAKLFGGTFVDMEDLATTGLGDLPLKAVISTVPNAAGFTLPPTLLRQMPVVLDVVYKPARTELLKQAQAAGCPVVQGATMLLTQGLEQFELWNKRRAPFAEMEAAIFAGVERID